MKTLSKNKLFLSITSIRFKTDFKLIVKRMELTVNPVTSEDFMTRFCSSLGLPKHVRVAAIHIANVRISNLSA